MPRNMHVECRWFIGRTKKHQYIAFTRRAEFKKLQVQVYHDCNKVPRNNCSTVTDSAVVSKTVYNVMSAHYVLQYILFYFCFCNVYTSTFSICRYPFIISSSCTLFSRGNVNFFDVVFIWKDETAKVHLGYVKIFKHLLCKAKFYAIAVLCLSSTRRYSTFNN